MSRKDRITQPRVAYSPAEVAAMLGISDASMARVLKARAIAFTKWGRRVLISRQALEEFLEGGDPTIQSRLAMPGAGRLA